MYSRFFHVEQIPQAILLYWLLMVDDETRMKSQSIAWQSQILLFTFQLFLSKGQTTHAVQVELKLFDSKNNPKTI